MTIKEKMRELGFSVYDTGGGCQAYLKGFEDEKYVFLTDVSGASLPKREDTRVLVGFYE